MGKKKAAKKPAKEKASKPAKEKKGPGRKAKPQPMGADFFSKKRRYGAKVHKATMKKIKAKQSKDTAVLKGLQITFDVPITKEIKDNIDPRLMDLVEYAKRDPSNRSFNVGGIEIDKKIVAGVSIFGANNFAKDAKPIADVGYDSAAADAASLDIKKVLPIEGDWYIRMVLTCGYKKELWLWLGDQGFDAECTLQSEPFQRELPFEEDEEDKKGDKKGDDSPGVPPEEVKSGQTLLEDV